MPRPGERGYVARSGYATKPAADASRFTSRVAASGCGRRGPALPLRCCRCCRGRAEGDTARRIVDPTRSKRLRTVSTDESSHAFQRLAERAAGRPFPLLLDLILPLCSTFAENKRELPERLSESCGVNNCKYSMFYCTITRLGQCR